MTKYHVITWNHLGVNLKGRPVRESETKDFSSLEEAMAYAEQERHNWHQIHVNKFDSDIGHEQKALFKKGKRVK